MAPLQTQAWVVEELGGPFKLLNVQLDEALSDEVVVE